MPLFIHFWKKVKEKGTLAAAPPVINLKAQVPAASGLSFPGKVLADQKGKFLFISDSNHDRVVIADLDGNVVDIAGSGEKGLQDGSFNASRFDNPQGLAFDSENGLLYVADTDNHSIRKLDLNSRTVETISGTGEQAYDRSGGKNGRKQGLNSPWDLALVKDKLYIAMAGPHQLWELELKTGIARNWIGSGRENIMDGVGFNVALAQPSGIVQKGDWLYFADSEVSALRRVNLESRKVETLIGTGLFDFGDKDGSFAEALLQHPLGVTVSGNDILVADTYNHKIKRAVESELRIEELTGIPPLDLYEPGGLSAYEDLLYIADTDHHRIIVFNMSTHEWHELKLKGLFTKATQQMNTDSIAVQEFKIQPDSNLAFQLAVEFSKGIHLNKEAPLNYALVSASNTQQKGIEGMVQPSQLPITFSVPASVIVEGEVYVVTLDLAYCTDGNAGLCIPATLIWKMRIKEDLNGTNKVELTDRVAYKK